MNRPGLLIAVALLLMALMLGGVVLQAQIKQERRLAARLQAVRRSSADAVRLDVGSGRGGAAAAIVVLGAVVARSGLLSRATIEQMQKSLTAAGWRGAGALGMFLGVKLLLLPLLPLLALVALRPLDLSPLLNNLGVAGAAVVGLLAPDWFVARHRASYRSAVAAALPDMLDMLVLCTEAGLGLEPALNRVGLEIRHAHPEMANELARTVVELRVVPDGRVALSEMGARTELPGLKRIGSTLAQTMQYGTPLGQALRVLSAEMRQETILRFEARAARLPVLLTLPMIAFILPCIFLIVGGPAFVQVMQSIHH